MQAELFYQVSDATPSIPLLFLTSENWENQLQNYPQYEQNLLNNAQFKAEVGNICLISNHQGKLEKVLIGVGKSQYSLGIAVAALNLPPGYYHLSHTVSEPILLNWALAQYRFENYKKQPKTPKVLIVSKEQYQVLVSQASAIFQIRDLINLPANDLGPHQLAQVVEKLAKQYHANLTQWIGEDLLTHNFAAIYNVGKAAMQAPRLLQLNWGDKAHPHIVLIGKGVCFDSGGLDIKPSSNMRLMKKDMAGAAHVIGLAQWIMENQLPIYLEVLIPAVENAVGPDAFHPGDIITMRNGLTVEVDNTDAEGRLILADAIVKACENKPELIVDFSTLTGAARVAVGTDIAAFFTNNQLLANELVLAALEINDPVWQLPLYEGYEESLNSTIADCVNAAPSSYAGAITAALFLQRFIIQPIPWIHFDIMAWNLTSKPGKPEGGEAMGFRALTVYLFKKYGISHV